MRSGPRSLLEGHHNAPSAPASALRRPHHFQMPHLQNATMSLEGLTLYNLVTMQWLEAMAGARLPSQEAADVLAWRQQAIVAAVKAENR